MNKIKIALVGCGRIATNHLEAIHKNNHFFDLVGVCDIIEERAKKTGEENRVPYFTDFIAMLDALPDIEIVSLCTVSGLHSQESILASNRGLHVLTEKPMATNLNDAKRMLEAAEKSSTQLFVVKQNRLNPTVQAVKRAIDNGDFGKIYLVHCNVLWQRPQSYYDQAPWRGTWALDGGAFMNQASHYVDLLQWFIGSVARVQAITKTLARHIEAEDSGVVNFEWCNGAIGSMAVTMLTYPKNLEGSIIIIGEKGTAALGGVALNEIVRWEFDHTTIENPYQFNYSADSVYGHGHIFYYENVGKVLRENAVPISDGHSGIKSIELLAAIYQSSQTHHEVLLNMQEVHK